MVFEAKTTKFQSVHFYEAKFICKKLLKNIWQ